MMNHDTMLLHLYVETGMSSHILCTSFIFNYRQCMLVYYTYANECGCTLQIWCMFAYNLVIIFSG